MKPSDRAFRAAEKGAEPAAAGDAMAGRNGIGRMSAVETAGIGRMRRIGDTCIIRRSKKFTGCGRAKHTLFLVTGIRRRENAPAAGGSAGRRTGKQENKTDRANIETEEHNIECRKRKRRRCEKCGAGEKDFEKSFLTGALFVWENQFENGEKDFGEKKHTLQSAGCRRG